MQIGRAVSVAFLLFVSWPASSLTLDDVRRSLAGMKGASSIEVRITTASRHESGKEKTQSSGTTVAQDDGELLRMVHRKSELQPRNERGPRADSSLEPGEAVELMNHAPILLKALEGATLRKTSAAVVEGMAVTLFEIAPKREASSSRFARFIRSFNDVLLVYAGPDGVPVASERRQNIKASLLVIRFEATSKVTQRFLRVADRLLVAKETAEFATSGLGQDDRGVETRTLSVVR